MSNVWLGTGVCIGVFARTRDDDPAGIEAHQLLVDERVDQLPYVVFVSFVGQRLVCVCSFVSCFWGCVPVHPVRQMEMGKGGRRKDGGGSQNKSVHDETTPRHHTKKIATHLIKDLEEATVDVGVGGEEEAGDIAGHEVVPILVHFGGRVCCVER